MRPQAMTTAELISESNRLKASIRQQFAYGHDATASAKRYAAVQNVLRARAAAHHDGPVLAGGPWRRRLLGRIGSRAARRRGAR